MQLVQFRQHLQNMDKAIGTEVPMFDCMAREVAPNTFVYQFDGYIVTKVQIFDNVVLQTCEGFTLNYADANTWERDTISAVGE